MPYEDKNSRHGVQDDKAAKDLVHEYGANWGNQWRNADVYSITAPWLYLATEIGTPGKVLWAKTTMITGLVNARRVVSLS